MKSLTFSYPRVVDIMTPRSVLKCAAEPDLDRAQSIAEENAFDAVPLLSDGVIHRYWSRSAKRPLPITKRHRLSHDTPIESVVSRLNDHQIQFIYYHTEVIGLLDLADLNKPLARLTWLAPILELEQTIVAQSLELNIPEAQIIQALGPRVARDVLKRRTKATQQDLHLRPLLSFAYFRDVLKVATDLEIVNIAQSELSTLNDLRNRLAHSTRSLIEDHQDARELMQTMAICRRLLKYMTDNG